MSVNLFICVDLQLACNRPRFCLYVDLSHLNMESEKWT